MRGPVLVVACGEAEKALIGDDALVLGRGLRDVRAAVADVGAVGGVVDEHVWRVSEDAFDRFAQLLLGCFAGERVRWRTRVVQVVEGGAHALFSFLVLVGFPDVDDLVGFGFPVNTDGLQVAAFVPCADGGGWHALSGEGFESFRAFCWRSGVARVVEHAGFEEFEVVFPEGVAVPFAAAVVAGDGRGAVVEFPDVYLAVAYGVHAVADEFSWRCWRFGVLAAFPGYFVNEWRVEHSVGAGFEVWRVPDALAEDAGGGVVVEAEVSRVAQDGDVHAVAERAAVQQFVDGEVDRGGCDGGVRVSPASRPLPHLRVELDGEESVEGADVVKLSREFGGALVADDLHRVAARAALEAFLSQICKSLIVGERTVNF